MLEALTQRENRLKLKQKINFSFTKKKQETIKCGKHKTLES
jgi:hypothetical protein